MNAQKFWLDFKIIKFLENQDRDGYILIDELGTARKTFSGQRLTAPLPATSIMATSRDLCRYQLRVRSVAPEVGCNTLGKAL